MHIVDIESYQKNKGKTVKHFKILLQLHSIKLILFLAVAIVFLAMTTRSSSNKTETTQADVSIANQEANSLAVASSAPTRIKKGIE